jgi:hypothetical protein
MKPADFLDFSWQTFRQCARFYRTMLKTLHLAVDAGRRSPFEMLIQPLKSALSLELRSGIAFRYGFADCSANPK